MYLIKVKHLKKSEESFQKQNRSQHSFKVFSQIVLLSGTNILCWVPSCIIYLVCMFLDEYPTEIVDKWGFGVFNRLVCRRSRLYSTNLVCLANERFWYWYGWNPYL